MDELLTNKLFLVFVPVVVVGGGALLFLRRGQRKRRNDTKRPENSTDT